jgi:hypothetical protein
VENAVSAETVSWRKATASDSNGSCVEVAGDGGGSGGNILVRDSKDPSGPVLSFTRAEMAAWVDGCRRGEFDSFT